MTKRILKVYLLFIDNSKSKPRPVLELNSPSDEHYNFQVAFITSKKPNEEYSTDIKLDKKDLDFDLTGLVKTSYIRLSKIFTINPEMVDLVIGDLPEKYEQDLKVKLKNHLNLN